MGVLRNRTAGLRHDCAGQVQVDPRVPIPTRQPPRVVHSSWQALTILYGIITDSGWITSARFADNPEALDRFRDANGRAIPHGSGSWARKNRSDHSAGDSS